MVLEATEYYKLQLNLANRLVERDQSPSIYEKYVN